MATISQSAQRQALAALASGRLSYHDGAWRCGSRRYANETIARIGERGWIAQSDIPGAVSITAAGRAALMRPPINHSNEQHKRHYHARAAGRQMEASP